MIAPAFAGNPAAFRATTCSTTSRMYWLTKTGISSARLYWENKLGFFNVKGVNDPGRRERVSARDLYGAAKLVGDRRIPNSFTTRSTTSAATLPPGNSRNSFPKTFARRSDRCERKA